jgi:serine/threonine protein kinase
MSTAEQLPPELGIADPRRFALGGMAELFLGRKSFPRGGWSQVVVKRMLPQHAKVPELVSRFREEARLGMMLRHANIVRVLDYAEIGGQHFMVMEQIDGVDLAAVAGTCRDRDVHMPQPVAAFFLNGIALALAYMADFTASDGRNLGLVHRDISPSNMLVSYEGVIKLIDFGVAKAGQREFSTQEGFFVGKYAYMSPEQVRSDPVDIRSDLFALGNVGFELLTGTIPFLGGSEFDTFNQILQQPTPPILEQRADVHPILAEVIERCLAKPVDERYQHPLEMVKDVQRYFHDAVEEPPSVLAVSFLEDLDLISGAQRPRDLTPSSPGAPAPGAAGPPPIVSMTGAPSPLDGHGTTPAPVVGENTTQDAGNPRPTPGTKNSGRSGSLLGLAVFGGLFAALLLVLVCGIGRWVVGMVFGGGVEPAPVVEPAVDPDSGTGDEGENYDHIWDTAPVTRFGTVSIHADVTEEVEIFHNGQSLGTTPINGLELEPGRYRFQARCDEYDWSSWVTVTVVGGEAKDVPLQPRRRQQAP